jgi:long-chain fatty acid transport protein
MSRRYVARIVSVLLAGAVTAAAQTDLQFNRPGSGARAAGMANAFIGISDDGTAASWNPAGLGQLRKPELSIVTNTIRRQARAEGFRSRDDSYFYRPTQSAFLTTSLDFASVALPVTIAGKPLTFQGAWRRLYTLEAHDNFDTARESLAAEPAAPTLISVNSDVLGSVDLLSIAGAIKLTRRLALGASFNLWRGEWHEHAAIGESAPGAASRFRQSRQDNRLDGDNVSLGLMLTYPRWSVGLLYLTPLASDYSADASLATTEPLPITEAHFDGTLRFGRSVGIGTAWRPGPQWTLAADVTWDDWKAATIEFPDQPTSSLFDGLTPELSSTRNTWSMNAGAERLFHGEGFVVPLRFGAAWEPQGGRDPYTRDPVNWVMFAAGTGYNTNTLKFDGAVQYRWANVIDGSTFGVDEPARPDLPEAVGERAAREWRIKFSVILRIADTDTLRGTVGKIFGDR